MPPSTFVEIPEAEQAQMRAARYGYLLALHILLLCAMGRNPHRGCRGPLLLALQHVPRCARLSEEYPRLEARGPGPTSGPRRVAIQPRGTRKSMWSWTIGVHLSGHFRKTVADVSPVGFLRARGRRFQPGS
jgi:hypothetical protein